MIKEYLKDGLKYVVLALTILDGFTLSDFVNLNKREYPIAKVSEINKFEFGKEYVVESIDTKFEEAELFRVLSYWYNPQVVKSIKFEGNLELTIKYPLFSNCSFIRRKVGGPEKGDTCIIKHGVLKKI